MEVNLEDLFENRKKKTVFYRRVVDCPDCFIDPNEKSCSVCGGGGKVLKKSGNEWVKCKACKGPNMNIFDCKNCENTRSVNVEERLEVELTNFSNKAYIAFEDKGNRIKNEKGILYIQLYYKDSDRFQLRTDTDLIQVIEVDFIDAILGCKKQISTLKGNRVLNIPKNTLNTTLLKIKGEGLNDEEGNSGDLWVKVMTKIPKIEGEHIEEKLNKV